MGIINFLKPTKKKLVITIAIIFLVFLWMFFDGYFLAFTIAEPFRQTIEATITFPNWQIQNFLCSSENSFQGCNLAVAGLIPTAIVYYLVACILASIKTKKKKQD
ncbi:MAG: hypothetical protein PHH08_02755 [Candidatus ainarchaeum sp.]|nr:hypothetical protein [Candidatus ainarchaeum sp.]